jgi:hypothetical protein
MMGKLGLAGATFAVLTFSIGNQFTAHLHAADIGQRARVLITEDIDESKLVRLRGNTRPVTLIQA